MKCLTLFVAARWIYYLRASLKKSTNCCCHCLLCFGLYTGPAKNLSHTRCPLRCFTPIPVDFFLLILLHQLILYIWELRTALDQLILSCAAPSAAEMFHLFRADSKIFKVWTPVFSAPTHNITIKAQLKLTLWLWLTVCHGKSPHMLLIGKPSISMGHLYHGYVSHNQMVTT